MVDRLGDRFLLFPPLESLSLGWFICFVIFGLAYYTNPSEKSFKSFIDKFPFSTYQSLPKNDTHPNRTHHPIQRSRSKNRQQQPIKQSPTPRSLKNPSQALSTSPQVSFSLCTSHYNRHNLVLCTLISVDRSRHLDFNISFDHTEDDSYPQLEWFFGCFHTWFSLRRRIPSSVAFFSIVSVLQTFKASWKQWRWPIPDLLPPPKLSPDDLSSSLQDLSPLIKPKRKKSARTQKPPLQCETSVPRDHSSECSTPEHSYRSSTSGRDSDCYSVEQSSPTCEPGKLSLPDLSVSLPTQHDKTHTVHTSHMSPTAQSRAPQTSGTNSVYESNKPSNAFRGDSTTRSELESSSDRPASLNPLPLPSCEPDPPNSAHDPEPKSLTSSTHCHQSHENYAHPSSDPSSDHDENWIEFKHKHHQKDLNKMRDQLNNKHTSSEIKDWKDVKQAKPDQPRHHLCKQLGKVKTDFSINHNKRSSINAKVSQDPRKMTKEEEPVNNATRLNKTEGIIKFFRNNKDMKNTKENKPNEKMAIRQTELIRKREVPPKQAKPSSHLGGARKVDRQSAVQESEARKLASLLPSSGPSTPSPPPDHMANMPGNMLHGISTTSIPAMLPTHPLRSCQLENFNSSLLLHDAAPHYPVSDPWAPDPWAEAIQQSHIRDSFISLPNLERSALKDHYPNLRVPAHVLPLHPITPSSLTEELFNYQQELNLPPLVTSSPEWVFPPPIQTSPFGAIGQQGSGTSTAAHASPVSNSSLFRFPSPAAPTPHLIENAFMVRSNSARRANISRTSSSNSLSQLPGYRSARSSPSLSPYAPIGTPLHPRHGALNEVSEPPVEGWSSANLDYSLNCATSDRFSGRVTEGNVVEPGLGHCTTLRSSRHSQGLMTFDPTVSSPALNSADAFPPLKSMKKPPGSGHHSTQSLNGIPRPGSNALNSIFDVMPEKDIPTLNSSAKPPRSALGLNPSAKVFSFGGSKTPSGQNSCPAFTSVDRQRTRGYSQSNVLTSDSSASSSNPLLVKAEEDREKSKNVQKSLHRSSWSVVLDAKGSSSHDFRPSPIGISNLKYDEFRSNLRTRHGVLSELSRLSSDEEALPMERSKSACSGLFGSIGDMKAKKTSTLSPTNGSPSAKPSVLRQPLSSSP